MSRPTVLPDFATDTNYGAGTDPWSATPTKVDPGGIKNTGIVPKTLVKAQHVNYMLNNHAAWIDYHDSLLFGATTYTIMEDFDQYQFTMTNATTPFPVRISSPFAVLGDTKFEVRIDNDASVTAGVYGLAKMMTVDGSATVGGFQSSRLGIGTQDYDFHARARVDDKAHLNTVALGGFQIGVSHTSGVFIAAGNDQANWRFIDSGGTSRDTGVAVVNGTLIKIQISRINGNIFVYINGSQVYTAADAANITAGYPFGAINGIVGGAAHNVMATIDYLRFTIGGR